MALAHCMHSEYVTLIAFPLQQWLHELVSMLRYTCMVCLVAYGKATQFSFAYYYYYYYLYLPLQNWKLYTSGEGSRVTESRPGVQTERNTARLLQQCHPSSVEALLMCLPIFGTFCPWHMPRKRLLVGLGQDNEGGSLCLYLPFRSSDLEILH